MKVLIPCPSRMPFNWHLHWGFLIKTFEREGHTVLTYGPGVESLLPATTPIPYREDISMGTIQRELGADLFVTMGSNSLWLGWHDVSCPKASLFTDFHYLKHLRDFSGCDILFVRARRFVKDAESLGGRGDLGRIEWLPFSYDQELMEKASEAMKRRWLVFFAGSSAGEHYPIRSSAVAALRSAGLLSRDSAVGVYHHLGEYYARMKRNLFGLTCSSRWRVNVAKHIEIPAAGAVLLTDAGPEDGMGRLLPEELYVRYTPENVVDVVRRMVEEPEMAEEIGHQAQKHCEEHHTDKVRAKEMCAVLREEGML